MLTLKTSKKEENFINLLKKAYALIKQKKFSEAVKLYHEIDDDYRKLDDKYKTEKLKKDIATLRLELVLYLRVNEAFVYSEEGNLNKLKEELDLIHNSLYDMEQKEDTRPLLDYVQNHYKFFLDIYTYKTTQEGFEENYKQLQRNIATNHLDEARKLYSLLLIQFNKLESYLDEFQKEKLYAKLKDAFKELSIRSLLKEAHQKPKHITIKREPIVVDNVPLPKPVELNSIIKQQKVKKKEYKSEYDQLRELLNQGEFNKAEEMLDRL